ncbi:MAG: helix-turn-helix domain-containing protein [Chloroflexota bacterium]|nr:helix-turn-helix domain-containing protein [Chloroflexota bacterium]
MTQPDLAARVNRLGGDMRQSGISRLERGQVTLPRSHRLQQIAEALDITPGELLARGGWSGADSPFVTSAMESGAEHAGSAPRQPAPEPCPEAAQTTGEEPRSHVSERDSLAARTEHILQRCREEVEMVRRFLDGEGGERLLPRS